MKKIVLILGCSFSLMANATQENKLTVDKSEQTVSQTSNEAIRTPSANVTEKKYEDLCQTTRRGFASCRDKFPVRGL